jgi:hypothetical protein
MSFERSGFSGVKEKATDKLQTDSNNLNTGTGNSSSSQFTDNW